MIYLDPPLPVLLPALLGTRGRVAGRGRGRELRLSRGHRAPQPLLLVPDGPLEVVDVCVNNLGAVFVLGLLRAAHQGQR